MTSGHNVYHEDMRKHPKGMIKEMLKTFGADFQELLDIDNVHSVKYLVNIKKLEFISSESAYKQKVK